MLNLLFAQLLPSKQMADDQDEGFIGKLMLFSFFTIRLMENGHFHGQNQWFQELELNRSSKAIPYWRARLKIAKLLKGRHLINYPYVQTHSALRSNP